ncbi:jerky protein homolog [Pseudophryne corroboree]|uniref:jerky protein homolog n=1 Tax=Pseudophryne corroboree TaxID=495146 RepID=UPI0030812C83
MSIKRLIEEFGVGVTTIHDLKKQKAQLLKFYAESDEQKLMNNRKTLHKSKIVDLDRVLKEWIRQRRSEHVPLTGWLQKFKKRHGITFLKICGDKASADQEAAEKFIGEFAKITADENITPEQVYNADETSLFWRYCPRKTLTTADDSAPTGIKDSKERITVLGCANAAGTHKSKLVVIGKSLRPRCLKGVNFIPVHYYANRKAWVTREIFSDWFHKHFVPEARAHCREAGLDDDCKILLLLDNCSAHPSAELLIKNNVYVIYFPPNVTSLIQPCDQGILRSLKSKYKNSFLNNMLAAVNRGMGVQGFQKAFSFKDSIYAVANAWNKVTKETVMHAWHNLWPATMFSSEDDEADDFEGFHISSEQAMVSDLLAYARNIPSESINNLEEADIAEVFDIDNDAPVIHSLTDGEIAEMVLNEGGLENSDDEDDVVIVNTAEKISIDDMVKMCDGLIEGLEQRAFITEQEVMSVYKIKDRLLRQKPLLMKQMTLVKHLKKPSSRIPPHLYRTHFLVLQLLLMVLLYVKT